MFPRLYSPNDPRGLAHGDGITAECDQVSGEHDDEWGLPCEDIVAGMERRMCEPRITIRVGEKKK